MSRSCEITFSNDLQLLSLLLPTRNLFNKRSIGSKRGEKNDEMGQTCCTHPTTEERLSESRRTNSKGEEVQQQHSSATTSGTTRASSSVVEQDKMEACREFAGLPLPPVADVKFSRSPGGVAHTKREDGNNQRRARGISSPIVELDQVGISSRSNSNSAVQMNSLGHAIVLGGEHQPLKLASPTSAECRPECGTNLPDDGNENPDPIMRSVGYAANEPGKTEMDAKIKTIILRAELTMALEDDENEEEDWSMAPPPQGRSTSFRQQYQEQQSGGNLIGVLATGNSTAPHNRVSFPGARIDAATNVSWAAGRHQQRKLRKQITQY